LQAPDPGADRRLQRTRDRGARRDPRGDRSPAGGDFGERPEESFRRQGPEDRLRGPGRRGSAPQQEPRRAPDPGRARQREDPQRRSRAPSPSSPPPRPRKNDGKGAPPSPPAPEKHGQGEEGPGGHGERRGRARAGPPPPSE